MFAHFMDMITLCHSVLGHLSCFLEKHIIYTSNFNIIQSGAYSIVPSPPNAGSPGTAKVHSDNIAI